MVRLAGLAWCVLVHHMVLASSTPTKDSPEASPSSNTKLTMPQKVKRSFEAMASDWEVFRGLFAPKATIKWCIEGSASCRKGTFDQHFGKFEDAIKSIHVEDTSLVSSDTTDSDAGYHKNDWLQHFTNHIETPIGCSAIWSGFATYEFNNKEQVERLTIYAEQSKQALTCIAQFVEYLKENPSYAKKMEKLKKEKKQQKLKEQRKKK